MPNRSPKSTIPQIALPIWRSLYGAADELRQLALWDELGDADLLGVEHPSTGAPMLGVMMGALGQVFGLALHHGEEGVRFASEAALGRSDEPDMEEFRSIAVLEVEFVPKQALRPEEKRRVKELNFRPAPARPLLWPSFESLHPGYLPWHLEGPEAEVLLHALPRLAALGAALREFYRGSDVWPDGEFAFWPHNREPGEPLRVEEIEWRRLSVPPRPEPVPVTVEQAAEAALKSLPHSPSLAVEVDAFTGASVIDEGARPWLMKIGAIAEARSGAILAVEMGNAPEERIETLAGRVFLQAIEGAQLRPATVRVRQVRIQKALEQICDRLGVRLELRRQLPAVAQFQAATAERFGSGWR